AACIVAVGDDECCCVDVGFGRQEQTAPECRRHRQSQCTSRRRTPAVRLDRFHVMALPASNGDAPYAQGDKASNEIARWCDRTDLWRGGGTGKCDRDPASCAARIV